MKKTTLAKLNRLLRRFEIAAREHEMKGAYCPEDQKEIEDDYRESKRNLRTALGLRKPN